MVRAHEFRRYSRSSTTQLPSCCFELCVFFVFQSQMLASRFVGNEFSLPVRKPEDRNVVTDCIGWFQEYFEKSELTFITIIKFYSTLSLGPKQNNFVHAHRKKDSLNNGGSP